MNALVIHYLLQKTVRKIILKENLYLNFVENSSQFCRKWLVKVPTILSWEITKTAFYTYSIKGTKFNDLS